MQRASFFGTLILAAGLLAVLGCSSSDGPTLGSAIATPGTSYDNAALSEQVPVWEGHAESEQIAMTAELNEYRRQSGLGNFPLNLPDGTTYPRYANILFTAAVRHAGYLDSMNSINGEEGPDLVDEDPTTAIDIEDDIVVMYNEPVIPIGPDVTPPQLAAVDGLFPVFYTHPSLRRRILAVVGGPDLLAMRRGTRNVFECYVMANAAEMVNGITDPANPVLSNFRGLGGSGHIGSLRKYTPGMNLWYHPAWRLPAMRASTRWMGYGTVEEARERAGFAPPFPVLSSNGPQAFGGVCTFVEEGIPFPVVAPAIWPENGSTNVQPYGFDAPQDDTDVPIYPWLSGPPLHVIFPSIEWMDTVTVNLYRSDANGNLIAGDLVYDPITDSTFGTGAGDQYIWVFGNAINLGGGGLANQFTADGGTDLFYGTIGAGGGGGGGGLENTIFHTNFKIAYIDNPNNDVPTPVNPNDPHIETAVFSLGAPSLLLTTIVFEGPLTPEVQINDTIDIGAYIDPLLGSNPGSESSGYPGFNAGTVSIVWISTDRAWVQVTPTLSSYDETANVAYNNFGLGEGLGGDGTNAACTVSGLRTTSGGGNDLAQLRNGEFIMIPADPLISGAYYTLSVAALSITGEDFSRQTTFQVK